MRGSFAALRMTAKNRQEQGQEQDKDKSKSKGKGKNTCRSLHFASRGQERDAKWRDDRVGVGKAVRQQIPGGNDRQKGKGKGRLLLVVAPVR